VEKKRFNFFIRTKLTFTAIFLSLIFSTHAQKLETFKNYCGGFYKSMADLQKMQQREIGFYDFTSGQTIASIGGQCCHWEAAYAALLTVLSSIKILTLMEQRSYLCHRILTALYH